MFRSHEAWLEEQEEAHGLFDGGDPRRCPIHPGEKTSSDDGMHDAPCCACEWENSEEGFMARHWQGPVQQTIPAQASDDGIPF